jgi:hypothetical protein
MKSMRILLLGLLSIGAAGLATPAFAWLNNSEQPGSVLVFPKFIRGTINDLQVSGQAFHAITELQISVVCPKGAICDANQKVRLRAHWVCPGCTETSFNLETTVGGTLFFNPEGVTVLAGQVTAQVFPNNSTTTIPLPPCERGYLIVWAVDGGDFAVKFDGLIGDAVIREPTPGCNGPCSARGYNAIPIQASQNLPVGTAVAPTLTDVNADGALDFDGNEYEMITGRIFGTVRYESTVVPGAVRTDLTLLTLDVASNRPNPLTSVGLNFFTPDEQFTDAGTSFVCWREQRLTDINAGLTTQRMGRKGLVASYFAEQVNSFGTTVPVTLLGLIETQEFFLFPPNTIIRDWSYSLFNDGNPVPTTFRP